MGTSTSTVTTSTTREALATETQGFFSHTKRVVVGASCGGLAALFACCCCYRMCSRKEPISRPPKGSLHSQGSLKRQRSRQSQRTMESQQSKEAVDRQLIAV